MSSYYYEMGRGDEPGIGVQQLMFRRRALPAVGKKTYQSSASFPTSRGVSGAQWESLNEEQIYWADQLRQMFDQGPSASGLRAAGELKAFAGKQTTPSVISRILRSLVKENWVITEKNELLGNALGFKLTNHAVAELAHYNSTNKD